MAGSWQIRRSHGMLGGVLLILLGAWGGIIPFVGPYFNYAFTPDKAWTWNTDRLYLEVLPGALAVMAGLLLVMVAARHTALFGALLGVIAGAWFALGQTLSPLWSTGHVQLGGSPASTTYTMRMLEQIGFFTGLGVAIVLVAAATAGRLTAVPSAPVQSAPPPMAEPVTMPDATVPAAMASLDADSGLSTATMRTVPPRSPASAEDPHTVN
jgi:hypothetical protein